MVDINNLTYKQAYEIKAGLNIRLKYLTETMSKSIPEHGQVTIKESHLSSISSNILALNKVVKELER